MYNPKRKRISRDKFASFLRLEDKYLGKHKVAQAVREGLLDAKDISRHGKRN